MKLHGRKVSDLIRDAFVDGFDHGRRDVDLKKGEPAAWKYSNTFYVRRDIQRKEEENEHKRTEKYLVE